jgi:hypothetical protein
MLYFYLLVLAVAVFMKEIVIWVVLSGEGKGDFFSPEQPLFLASGRVVIVQEIDTLPGYSNPDDNHLFTHLLFQSNLLIILKISAFPCIPIKSSIHRHNLPYIIQITDREGRDSNSQIYLPISATRTRFTPVFRPAYSRANTTFSVHTFPTGLIE